MGFNPYIWGDQQHQTKVGSGVLSIDVTACNRTSGMTDKPRTKRSIATDGSKQNFLEVELKVTESQPECSNRTVRPKEQIIHHVASSSEQAKVLKVLIEVTENSSHSIDVYLGYGSKPTITHYDLKSSLRIPENGYSNDSRFLEFISAETLTNNATRSPMDVYVGLIPTGK